MRKLWDSPSDSRQQMKRQQASGYRTGEALRAHVVAHGGAVLDSCPACQEIQRKMTEAKGTR